MTETPTNLIWKSTQIWQKYFVDLKMPPTAKHFSVLLHSLIVSVRNVRFALELK